MATMMKHVGKFGEKPCVVIFRELPNEPENCLIVQTSNLVDADHDDLMSIIQSDEAQKSNDVSQVLHRRQFRSGENVLNALHFGKKLQKVPVSHVSLTPTPSHSLPLADVNAEIRKIEGGYVPPKTEQLTTEPRTETAVTDAPEVQTESVAASLLAQAALIEEDAKILLADAEAKKAEAYRLDPTLLSGNSDAQSVNKRKPGRPKKTA